MKSFYSRLMGIVMFSFIATFICMQSATAMAAPTGGMITGKVTKSDGVTPIGGVKIMAVRMGSDESVSHAHFVRTSENGKFVFQNLPTGNYSLVIHSDGYVSTDKSDISVAYNKVTKNVNFILVEEALITGKVIESTSGEPIENVTVSIDGPDKIPVANTTTDSLGRYRLDQIIPNTYWIRAVKDGYAMEVTLPTQLDEGQALNGINFSLCKGAEVNGSVYLGKNNEPVEAYIYAFINNQLFTIEKTNPSGMFSINNLPAGRLDLVVYTENYPAFINKLDVSAGEVINDKVLYVQCDETEEQ